jgi:hypothetical protein
VTTRHCAMLCLTAIMATALARGALAVNVDFGKGPARPEETIDAAVQRADVIVRGTAVSIERLDLYSAAESRFQTAPVAHVTLHVSEVLKGPHVETCTFRAKVDDLDDGCSNWVKSGGKTEALFFLIWPKTEMWATSVLGADPTPFIVQQRNDWFGFWAFPLPSTLELGRRPIDVFGIRHDADDSLLATIQDAVQAKLISPDLIEFAPWGSVYPGYSERFVAPVTTRMELLARRWIRERDQVETAVRVLRRKRIAVDSAPERQGL